MTILPSSLLSLLLLASPLLSSPIPSTDESGRLLNRNSVTVEREYILRKRIDYSVPLTYPTAGDVFQAGDASYITWNSTLPGGIKQNEVPNNYRLVLGYEDDTSAGYHLDLVNPLGTNIDVFASNIYNFTFPANLTTRTTYLLAFMGSSGNVSPEFTINSLSVHNPNDNNSSNFVSTVAPSGTDSASSTSSADSSASTPTDSSASTAPSSTVSSSAPASSAVLAQAQNATSTAPTVVITSTPPSSATVASTTSAVALASSTVSSGAGGTRFGSVGSWKVVVSVLGAGVVGLMI